jgi:hypothetical protein
MAGDWIKLEKATLDKPEVFEMAGLLGIDPDAVIGKLLRVWDWFDDQSIDGYAPVTLAAQLNRNSGYAGFTEAMKQVGWLAEENGKISIPNFHRHNGETSKQRALSAKRMAKRRAKSDGDSVTTSVTKVQPEKRREEKSIIVTLKSNKAKGSIDELKTFCAEIGMPESDGESMFHHWEANGWKNGSSPSKDWKAGIRKWKSQGWLPSQKKTNGHRKNEYPQETLQLPD